MVFLKEKFLNLLDQRKGLLIHLREMLKNPSSRAKIIIWILLISITFTGIVFYKNIGVLREQELNFDYRSLLISFLVFPLGFIPTTVAWHNLLLLLGIRLSFLNNLKYYCLSSFPRHIPGFLVYFTSRSLLYENQNIDSKDIVVASTLEILLLSLVGFMFSFVIFSVSSVFSDYLKTAQIVSIIFLIVLALTILFFRLLKKRIFRGINLQPEIFIREKDRLAITIYWILISWVGGGIFLFFVINIVSPLNWTALPIVIAIWAASGAMSMILDAFTSGFSIRVLSLGALLSMLIPPVSSIVVAVGINVVFIISEFFWIAVLLLVLKNSSQASALEIK
jgi:hypothetical protein